jgi:hypothetical protein
MADTFYHFFIQISVFGSIKSDAGLAAGWSTVS